MRAVLCRLVQTEGTTEQGRRDVTEGRKGRQMARLQGSNHRLHGANCCKVTNLETAARLLGQDTMTSAKYSLLSATVSCRLPFVARWRSPSEWLRSSFAARRTIAAEQPSRRGIAAGLSDLSLGRGGGRHPGRGHWSMAKNDKATEMRRAIDSAAWCDGAPRRQPSNGWRQAGCVCGKTLTSG